MSKLFPSYLKAFARICNKLNWFLREHANDIFKIYATLNKLRSKLFLAQPYVKYGYLFSQDEGDTKIISDRFGNFQQKMERRGVSTTKRELDLIDLVRIAEFFTISQSPTQLWRYGTSDHEAIAPDFNTWTIFAKKSGEDITTVILSKDETEHVQ